MNRYGPEKGKEEIIKQLSESYETEKIEACLGDGIKKLAPAEKANYGRTNRSLHFMRAMKKGERVLAKDIGVLRTEKVLTPGISPEFFDEIAGSVLVRDAENGEGVLFSHFISK